MAEVKNIKLNVTSNIKDVSKDTKGLNQNISLASSGASDLSNKTATVGKTSGGIGALSGSLGKLSPALAGANAAAGGLLKTMWALVANPIGAIIAGIVLSLTALYKAFSSTKAGGEQIKQIMSGIGAAIDVLRDRVLKIGGAIVKFFSGDLKGAFSDAKAAVSGIGAEIESEFKQAAKAKRYLQEVTDSVRSLSVSRAKLNRDLARSKEIINDESASYADKKKAIEAVKLAEEKQTAQELKNAEKKLKAIKIANSLSDTDAENLDKQAAAEAELFALQQKSAEDRRAIAKTELRADKEEKSRIKELADARTAAAKERQSQQKELDKQRDDSLKKITELEQAHSDSLLSNQNLELLNVKRKYEEQIKLAEKYGHSTTKLKEAEASEILKIEKKYYIEKAKIEQEANDKRIAIEDAQFKLTQEITYSEQEKEIAALVESYDAKFAIAEGNAELEKKLTERQKLEIDAINKKFNEKEIADSKAVKDKQNEINKEKRESQIQAVQSGLAVIGNLAEVFAGKSRKSQERAFKVQKAANIASATIDTYKSAQSAFASAGNPILGAIFAAAAVTAGLLNIKRIQATKFDGGGDTGGSAPATPSFTDTPSQTTSPQAPSFNVVGNSGINQLAQINQQPVQAYVVSGQMTTAQSLDRNKIENATIG